MKNKLLKRNHSRYIFNSSNTWVSGAPFLCWRSKILWLQSYKCVWKKSIVVFISPEGSKQILNYNIWTQTRLELAPLAPGAVRVGCGHQGGEEEDGGEETHFLNVCFWEKVCCLKELCEESECGGWFGWGILYFGGEWCGNDCVLLGLDNFLSNVILKGFCEFWVGIRG